MKIIRFLMVSSVVTVLFLSVAFAQNTTVVPISESVVEPYISVSPDYFYPLEEILYVEGRANSNAIVTVTFQKQGSIQKQGDRPVNFTVKADSFGEWVVAEKTFLSAGDWQVRARQKVGPIISGDSNPRVVRSVVNGVNLFGIQVRYAIITIVVVIFLAVIGFIFFYFRRKVRRLQRGLLHKQLKETEERFHEGFAEVRKELMDQLRDLAANTQGRPLSPDEIEKKDRILRELDDLEKNLDHDIGDIGKNY